jgi:methyl-accepting chemotaxis protein
MKVGIVGGGKAGTLFLKALIDISEVNVIGICDKNSNAPGVIFAQEQNIPIYLDIKEFLETDMDVLLELTGNEAVKNIILQYKKEETHFMDSHAAKLASLLTEHQQELSNKLADYINHIKQLLISVTSNISAINETVSSIDDTSKKIISSVASSMESINKTDDIVKIINDITTRIKILGINASIEAAHAGEAGKGFSVVASEIGNLTSSSTNATADIKSIIDEMKVDVNNLLNIANSLKDICNKQSEVASSLAEDNEKMSNIISK